jgi:UDP-N-acetylglucosamine 2-epimerase (non-hydrolysing)/GDP/UDP-N,N'-diacetylbacillosamine 2-epimerase (hydrolysing)
VINNKRKIAVFTGNRAEYGLLYPVLKELNSRSGIDFHLIVSGAHLDSSFGNTIKAIQDDGFKISSEVKIDLAMNELATTAKAIGVAILSLVNELERIAPDIFVVYADRFEGFAATIAGTQMRIPTAHIEGGDVTEGGAFDDSVRHAMTKLSHLHFTTNQQAANRILAMGEEEWRVHNVGFPGIDLIKAGRVTSTLELVKNYNIDLSKPIIVFTQHPVATEFENTKAHIEESLKALQRHASEGVQVIITYPNNDAGCQIIIDSLIRFSKEDTTQNIQLVKSLGQENYYGLLSLAQEDDIQVVCCGNSSSGIKETAAFCCPTVNIGARQNGRLRAENVIDATYDQDDIYEKIKKALYNKEFRTLCRNIENPYGTGNAAKKITEVLLNIPINQELLNKKMTLKGIVQNGWFA